MLWVKPSADEIFQAAQALRAGRSSLVAEVAAMLNGPWAQTQKSPIVASFLTNISALPFRPDVHGVLSSDQDIDAAIRLVQSETEYLNGLINEFKILSNKEPITKPIKVLSSGYRTWRPLALVGGAAAIFWFWRKR